MSYIHFGRSATTMKFRMVAMSSREPVSPTVITIRKTLAGPASAFVDSMINFPFIFFKNMIQTDGFSPIKEDVRQKRVTPLQVGKMAYSGFGSFYAGYAGSMAASHFLNHELGSIFNPDHIKTQNPGFKDYAIPIVSSAIAGCFIVTPTELLMFKQQVAAANKQPTTLSSLVKTIFRTSGISGFFQSAALTTSREGAFGATVFLPPVVQRQLELYDMNKWAAFFVANTVVSVVSATLSNPVDALTTRYRKAHLGTPLGPWILKETRGNMLALMTKSLGTRCTMYFIGGLVLNAVRPIFEGTTSKS